MANIWQTGHSFALCDAWSRPPTLPPMEQADVQGAGRDAAKLSNPKEDQNAVVSLVQVLPSQLMTSTKIPYDSGADEVTS